MRQVRISVMSSFLLLCFMAEPKTPKTHSHASEKTFRIVVLQLWLPNVVEILSINTSYDRSHYAEPPTNCSDHFHR